MFKIGSLLAIGNFTCKMVCLVGSWPFAITALMLKSHLGTEHPVAGNQKPMLL